MVSIPVTHVDGTDFHPRPRSRLSWPKLLWSYQYLNTNSGSCYSVQKCLPYLCCSYFFFRFVFGLFCFIFASRWFIPYSFFRTLKIKYFWFWLNSRLNLYFIANCWRVCLAKFLCILFKLAARIRLYCDLLLIDFAYVSCNSLICFFFKDVYSAIASAYYMTIDLYSIYVKLSFELHCRFSIAALDWKLE